MQVGHRLLLPARPWVSGSPAVYVPQHSPPQQRRAAASQGLAAASAWGCCSSGCPCSEPRQGCCAPEPLCLLIAPGHHSFPWDTPKAFSAKVLPMPVGHQGLSLGSGFIPHPHADFGLHFLPCALLSSAWDWACGSGLGLEPSCSLRRFPMQPHAHLPAATERATKTSHGGIPLVLLL